MCKNTNRKRDLLENIKFGRSCASLSFEISKTSKQKVLLQTTQQKFSNFISEEQFQKSGLSCFHKKFGLKFFETSTNLKIIKYFQNFMELSTS